MKISVDEVLGGWVVVGGTTMGPFPNKRRAIDLAQGMVGVLKTHGEQVELFVDGAVSSEIDLADGAPMSSAA